MSRSNLLDRASFRSENPDLTPLQSTIDSSVSGFVVEVADEKGLAAMVAGGLAFRGVRLASLATGSRYLSQAPLLVRYGSFFAGLGGESAVFAGMNRGFNFLEDRPSPKSFSQEWFHSLISLGALRLFGKAGEGQNPLLQHFFADGGLLFGHQVAYQAGLEEKPEGDFLAQLLHAEAINWQMKGSGAFLHGIAPGYAALEKTLDRQFILQSSLQESKPLFSGAQPLFASAGSEKFKQGFLTSLSKALPSMPETPAGSERFKSAIIEKTPKHENDNAIDLKETLTQLEDLPRNEALKLLDWIYAQGKLGELLLTMEEKYMPRTESREFQGHLAIRELRGEEAKKEFEESAPRNDPLEFSKAHETLGKLKSDFLAFYQEPANASRTRKLKYAKWYLGFSENGIPMELSWESFVRRQKTKETLVEKDPLAAKRLYEKAKRNPKLLDDLFQIAQLALFINSRRMNRYDDSKTPHFRDLILGKKGVCAGFSCLFSDLASLTGLKIYTGRAPNHVYIYTNWSDHFVETTLFYNLRVARNPNHGTENFGTERFSPASVVTGQIEYLDYLWARMPTEYLKLRSNLASSEEELSHENSKLAFRYLEEGKVEAGISILQDLLLRHPEMKIPMDGPDSLDEIAFDLKNRNNPQAAQSIYDFAFSLPSRNQDWMNQDEDINVEDLPALDRAP